MLLLRFPIVTSVACMLMLNAMNVWSHAKTDVITVSNGDRITGAMTEMTSGKLSVSTSYAGTISVKWREISQIDSRYVYEVRLDDGERIYGRFAASDIPEQLTFRRWVRWVKRSISVLSIRSPRWDIKATSVLSSGSSVGSLRTLSESVMMLCSTAIVFSSRRTSSIFRRSTESGIG